MKKIYISIIIVVVFGLIFLSIIITSVLLPSGYNTRPINDVHLKFGLNPFWSSRHNKLFFCDALNGISYTYDPDSAIINSVTIANTLAFLYPLEEPNLYLAGIARNISLVSWDGTSKKPLDVQTLIEVDIDDEYESNSLSLAKCDVEGRLWIGTQTAKNRLSTNSSKNIGHLYAYSGIQLERKLTHLGTPIGITWNVEWENMFLTDTVQPYVLKFDYDRETGEISKSQKFYVVDESDYPTGIEIDSEDFLWVTFLYDPKLVMVDSKTGKVMQTIPIPAEMATGIVFGGKELDVLFITTASNESDKRSSPSGGLFQTTEIESKGIEKSYFKLLCE